jgi:predicted dehydrogenase
MDRTVRWGVLGTGKIARILATAIRESDDGELAMIGSRDVERAASLAAEFGARPGSYDDVVHDPDVDLVYVGIHHPLHREWAIRAADAGKQVLCEKPLAMRSDDAAEMVAAARRNDVLLLEAFAYLCHDQTAVILDVVKSGRIGELRMVDASFGYDAGPDPRNYLHDRELGGGAILDVGCYASSMAHLVVAAAAGVATVETTDVVARGRLSAAGVDLASAATLVFEKGYGLARVACAIDTNLDSTVQIYGSEGRIGVQSPWLPGRIGDSARVTVERWGTPAEVIEIPVETDVYTVEVNAVNRLVRKSERSADMMTWENSLSHLRTLDRWRAEVGVVYPGDVDR